MDEMLKAAVDRLEKAREVGVLKFPKYIQVSVQDRDLLLKALKKRQKQAKAEKAEPEPAMEFKPKRSVPDVVGKQPE